MTDKLDVEGNAVLDENGEPVQVEVDCNKSSPPWVFGFDSKKWSYKEPAKYPLADKDF